MEFRGAEFFGDDARVWLWNGPNEEKAVGVRLLRTCGSGLAVVLGYAAVNDQIHNGSVSNLFCAGHGSQINNYGSSSLNGFRCGVGNYDDALYDHRHTRPLLNTLRNRCR